MMERAGGRGVWPRTLVSQESKDRDRGHTLETETRPWTCEDGIDGDNLVGVGENTRQVQSGLVVVDSFRVPVFVSLLP